MPDSTSISVLLLTGLILLLAVVPPAANQPTYRNRMYVRAHVYAHVLDVYMYIGYQNISSLSTVPELGAWS